MSTSRIKRPRVALVSYAKEHYDKLPALVNSLRIGEIRQVLASGGCVKPLREMGVRLTDVSHMPHYADSALRGTDRYRQYGPGLPSIDMLCVTFNDLAQYQEEFGLTNDTQDMELISPEDLDRVSLVLSACSGRRVVTASPGWERGIQIDLLEARTESDAWIAARIREAMMEVEKYIGILGAFQERFMYRMGSFPRTNRPSRRAMCTCGRLYFQHTDSAVDEGFACHSFTLKQ